MAAALAAMLGGCWWQGPVFYAPDPAAPGPFQSGTYTFDMRDDGKPPRRTRVTRNTDGSLTFAALQEAGKPSAVVFAPLAASGRRIWISQLRDLDGKGQPYAIYGLAERHGAEIWLQLALDCDGNQAIVRAAGGVVSAGEDPTSTAGRPVSLEPPGAPQKTNLLCTFSDRASLERALAAYLAGHRRIEPGVVFKRVGNHP